jgi:hypothetical protein
LLTHTPPPPLGNWEGDDILETPKEEPAKPTEDAAREVSKQPTSPGAASESEGEGSEDDYVEESSIGKPTKVRGVIEYPIHYHHNSSSVHPQRASTRRRLSLAHSESDEAPSPTKRNRRQSTTALSSSPPPSALKRKHTDTPRDRLKRQRAGSATPTPSPEDPARKYCLGKLTETFVKIFQRYPHVQRDPDGTVEEVDPATLTDDEKASVERAGQEFAAGIEQAVFELYAEPDKNDKPSVGSKYK